MMVLYGQACLEPCDALRHGHSVVFLLYDIALVHAPRVSCRWSFPALPQSHEE